MTPFPGPAAAPAGPGGWAGRLRRVPWPGIAVAGVLTLIATHFGPANGGDVNLSLRQLGFSAEHPFGTDGLGRDLYDRVAAGLRRSLLVLAVVLSASLSVGVSLGLVAALGPRWLGSILLRLADLSVTVPRLIVALALTAALGLTPVTAAVALAASGWGYYAITTHALARGVMREPYWLATLALGTPRLRAAWRHVLPNIRRPLLALAGADGARTIILYASLAFIGLGADTSQPDLGAMVWEYRFYIFETPRLIIMPVLVIALVATGLHLLLDPGRGRL